MTSKPSQFAELLCEAFATATHRAAAVAEAAGVEPVGMAPPKKGAKPMRTSALPSKSSSQGRSAPKAANASDPATKRRKA
jgi:hypothetical protein